MALDLDGAAWEALESSIDPAERTEEPGGGTFLFARGRCLTEAWAGSCRAEDAPDALHGNA